MKLAWINHGDRAVLLDEDNNSYAWVGFECDIHDHVGPVAVDILIKTHDSVWYWKGITTLGYNTMEEAMRDVQAVFE